MNITGQPAYQKRMKLPSRRARPANAKERRYWDAAAKTGCIVGPAGCSGRITIHHCGTGAGGRKDHMRILPLCEAHHLGPEGIDGKRMSKREWQVKYVSEAKLMVVLSRKMKALGLCSQGESNEVNGV